MNRLVPLGILALALGVATLVVPLPIPADRVLVPLAGVGVLALIGRALLARRRTVPRRTGTGDPEVQVAVAVPGSDVLVAIREFTGGRVTFSREGLRDAAAAVLTRYAGLSPTEARTRIVEGTWTDDAAAAAHLKAGHGPSSWLDRTRQRLPWTVSYAAGRRRAIEEIARIADVPFDAPGREVSLPRWLTDDGVEEVPADVAPSRLETGTWAGVSAVALAALAVGLLADLAPVALAAVVGVGAAAYARVASPPAPDVAVERTVETTRPDPGEPVEVSLAVHNEGSRPLSDLRVVDGVPPALSVVAGSPRVATAVRPGGRATLTYTVEARRGVHAFEPVTVIARDLAGVSELRSTHAVETSLTVVPTPRGTEAPVPLRVAATRYSGPVQTGTGGEGVEFFASRAYQPGDPTSRIDWNRRARTGELATIDYREERAATVVVVVDARPKCFLAPDPHAPHAVDRSVDAAGRIVETLLDAGDQVGLAAFGTDLWLAPGSGRDQRARAVELLATHPGLTPGLPASDPPRRWEPRLERRLPTTAQLVVLTPLADSRAVRLVRTHDAAGHPASVVSPDPTAATAVGELLARTARRVRVTDLRRASIPVVDWRTGESLDVALARHAAGWSR